MDTVSIGLFGVLGLVFLALIYTFYLGYRNEKVYKFRTMISDKYIGPKAMQEIDNGKDWQWTHEIYDKLPSYDKMMFSFKPLKVENWISKEDLEKLKL